MNNKSTNIKRDLKEFVFILNAYNTNFINILRFVQVFQKYNKDKIDLYILCNLYNKDNFLKKNVKILNINEIVLKFLNYYDIKSIDNIQIDDQLIKMIFYKMNLAHNYSVINTNYHFFKNFYVCNFIAKNGNPYLVIDNNLIHTCNLNNDKQYSEQIINSYNMELVLKDRISSPSLTLNEFYDIKKNIDRFYFSDVLQKDTLNYQIPIGRFFYLCNKNDIRYKIDCVQGTSIKILKRSYLGYRVNQDTIIDGSITNINNIEFEMDEKVYKVVQKELIPSIKINICYKMSVILDCIKNRIKKVIGL